VICALTKMSSEHLYTGPIIDSHMHFWDIHGKPFGTTWSWIHNSDSHWAAKTKEEYAEKLQRNYLFDDYLQDIKDQNVVDHVHVEGASDEPLSEIKFIESLREKHGGKPSVQVARANLGAPEFPQLLQELRKTPSVKGIRQLLNWDEERTGLRLADRDYFRDAEFLRNFDGIAAAGYSFDLHVWPHQGQDAYSLVRSNPKVQFVVDHAGLPYGFLDTSDKVLPLWRSHVEQLAKFDNTVMKISGLCMTIHDVDVDHFRPYVDFIVNTFGPNRCMFASNFPVDRVRTSFANLCNVIKKCVNHLPTNDQKSLFHDTAHRVYQFGK